MVGARDDLLHRADMPLRAGRGALARRPPGGGETISARPCAGGVGRYGDEPALPAAIGRVCRSKLAKRSILPAGPEATVAGDSQTERVNLPALRGKGRGWGLTVRLRQPRTNLTPNEIVVKSYRPVGIFLGVFIAAAQ